MRKTVLLATAVFLMMSSQLVAQEQMCVPMGDITLAPLSQTAKRAEVSFPHAVHFSYACQKCHHKWDGRSKIKSCSTSECHDLVQAPKTKDNKPVKDRLVNIRYYKNAYHDMCISCHKEIKIKNKEMEASKASLDESLPPTGPTSCNKCHPKE
jgi:hypothetical protein